MKPTSLHTSKAIALFIIIGTLLSACGTPLWGSYDPYLTPTREAIKPISADPEITPTPTLTPAASTATLFPTISIPIDSQFTDTPAPVPVTSVPGSILPYTSQSGDSLNVVALHFGIQPADIKAPVPLSETGFINPGTLLLLPANIPQDTTTPSIKIIPDSELVDSPSSVGFDIKAYINTAGGKLSNYTDYLTDAGTISGAEDVRRISLGSSISPRLVLALIQYYTGWVQGQPKPGLDESKLFGYHNPSYDPRYPSLYQSMRLAIQDLLTGYYGWRAGRLGELVFPDGSRLRIAPDLNAGTVALQYFFSRHLNQADWLQVIDPESGFVALYKSMFGDPWVRANELGPLFPPNLNQPTFTLPFDVGVPWTLTGGPHPAWEAESAWGALDFAPPASISGCFSSDAWVVAVATGQIVRSESSYVVLDLDGDGFEQTGWVMIYQHIATKDRIPAGTRVNAGDHIGHPSCEGGATGTHVHIARKYNGEWVAAGAPLPFVLSGWTAHAGSAPYEGTLDKGSQEVTASQVSEHQSQIIRQPGE